MTYFKSRDCDTLGQVTVLKFKLQFYNHEIAFYLEFDFLVSRN